MLLADEGEASNSRKNKAALREGFPDAGNCR
jgi:hypothetical protein